MAYIQDIKVSIAGGSKTISQKGFGIPLIIGKTQNGDNTTKDANGKIIDPITERVGECRAFTDMDSVKETYLKGQAEYEMASAMFKQEPCPSVVYIYSRPKVGTATETISKALDKCKQTKPGFYAIFIEERTMADIEKAATWANTEKCLFFASTDSANPTFSTSFADMDRLAILCHTTPGNYPECAWAAQNLPKAPGSITWKWKSLSGQKAASYNSSDLVSIRNAKCQTISEIGGLAVVNEGRVAKGEYIDVVRGKDWIRARIEEGLYNLFISNDKVSMDNIGIGKVEGVIRSVLKYAGNMGIIARATTDTELKKSDDKEYMYQVTVPKREDILPADRAARKLPNVEFSYYLAGAIHEAQVQGKIITA